MAAFSTVTIVVFAGLGLVALALGLLARSYSAPALAAGLGGLLALTTASTWITQTGPGIDVQVIDKLKAEIATGKKGLQRSREQIPELEEGIAIAQSKHDQIRTDLAIAAARLGEAQQEAAKLKAEAERLTAALQAEHARRVEAQRKEAVAIAKAEQLEKQLREIEEKPVDPGILRRKLDARLESHFYTSQPLEQRELVAGLNGSWYVMRIKFRGKPLVFSDRLFRIPDAEQAVKESALQLHNEVIAPLTRVAKSKRLFVRGGADSRRVAGATEDPGAREFPFLPRLGDGTYAGDPRRRIPAVPVRNEDLPNLRADWLRQHIRPVLLTLGSGDIEILENPPEPGHERTVDLIMYVEW